jgi:hypothetical protein
MIKSYKLKHSANAGKIKEVVQVFDRSIGTIS